jgi:hypothetical protein
LTTPGAAPHPRDSGNRTRRGAAGRAASGRDDAGDPVVADSRAWRLRRRGAGGIARRSASDLLLKWYEEDVDPGVHGAVAWLFGQWGKAADLAKADESHAGRPRGKRRWFVTEEGQTMTVLEGPATVRMGSPADEPGRQPASDSAD